MVHVRLRGGRHVRYGGLVEVDDREITLCDMYALNLDRLDKFEVLQSQPTEDGWDASASEDEDDDGDDDEDDEDESDDEDGDGDEDDDTDDEAGAKDAAATPSTMDGVASVADSTSVLAEPAASAPDAAAAAAAEGAWDDDGFEPPTLVSTTTGGMTVCGRTSPSRCLC